jgi:hypothetical protein
VRARFSSTRNSVPSIFVAIPLGLACASRAERRKEDC